MEPRAPFITRLLLAALLLGVVGILAAAAGRRPNSGGVGQSSSAAPVVYVMATTTTKPPHVWVYDDGSGGHSVDTLLIQQRLVQLGYDVEMDGVYGPQTEAAVRAFQEEHRLWVDGIVGPVTAGALGLSQVLGYTGTTISSGDVT